MTDISTYEKIIDIYSKGDYPADALSNFYPHDFTIDGVACASMEGFLQSLKFASVKKQRKVCALSGIAAKKKGKRKFRWKLSGNVHWGGKKLSRTGEGFYALICRAYDALYAGASFAAALHAAKNSKLIHSIGGDDPTKTILTGREFIVQLKHLRQEHGQA